MLFKGYKHLELTIQIHIEHTHVEIRTFLQKKSISQNVATAMRFCSILFLISPLCAPVSLLRCCSVMSLIAINIYYRVVL